MDSNHDKELQRLLCYHYTTGQHGPKLVAGVLWRKGKTLANTLTSGLRGLWPP